MKTLRWALSKELAGVILPHDRLKKALSILQIIQQNGFLAATHTATWSHTGRKWPHRRDVCWITVEKPSIDRKLERKNFKEARDTLTEIWNNIVVDNYPAKFIENDEEFPVESVSWDWKAKHVRESQYFLKLLNA